VSLADLKARMGHDSVRAAMIYQRAMRSLKGGTSLEGNARGNPVMGHGPKEPGQAPDQASEGGQAGAGSTRDTSDQRHATRRSGTQRVTWRHQPPTWQDPPHNTADTCELILKGT
jgi:hypothetical protein